jgi:hypothetical protein
MFIHYFCRAMRPARFLLLLILASVLPWKSIGFCVAHPLGEPHHEGLSSCEKRALWKGGLRYGRPCTARNSP